MPCEKIVIDEGADVCRFRIENDPPLCRRRGEYLCMDAIQDNLPNLSHSAREMWVSCKRKYFLNKVKGIKAKQDKISLPLKNGTMWDKFIENQYGKSHDLSQLAFKLDMTELEIARFNAITHVYKKLKLADRDTNTFELQKKIVIPGDGINIVGYVDRAYDDHFVEVKMSTRPQYYAEPFNIGFQVGIYFLSNPNWKYVVMEVARTPTMTWDRENMDLGKYEEVLAKEIYKKAPMYFPGLKRKDCTYGKKYFRSEFPLDNIAKTYERVNDEIKEAARKGEDWFYQSFNCSSPYPCDFLPICKDNVISNVLFEMRKKPEEEGE